MSHKQQTIKKWVSTDKYRENYEAIFKKRKRSRKKRKTP